MAKEKNFSSEIVFRNKYLCVSLNTPDEILREEVFFTFDGLPGGFKTHGFGTEFLAKNGFLSIHVTCEKNTSYQNVTSNQFLEVARDFVKDKKVYLYGSSVGGYAALYFSHLVSGTVIAFSPLCPPDPVLGGAFKSGQNQPFLHQILNEKLNENSIGNPPTKP